MSFKFPLATKSWDEAEIAAIQSVVDSGFFTMNGHVAQFERDFAAYQGSRYAVMVNSGSSANLVMIAALFFTRQSKYRLKAGDEVIVPAVSWATTYYPLQQYGLKLKFVDIDMATLNMSIEGLKAAISPATRAILAVNLLGNPNDFRQINEIIAGRDIILLEDNCESMGAEQNGIKAGSFGLMGTFSSFFSHHISTMEGGLVVTDDEELYQILISLRAHGWTRNLPEDNLVSGRKSSDPFEESFKFVLPGYNLRPLEMSGAIGVEQVKKLPSIIEGRRRNGEALQDAMANHPTLMIQQETGRSSWFGFSLVIRPGADLTRQKLLGQLRQEGFEVRPIVTGNFTRNPVMSWMDCDVPNALPNADHIHDNGLFVGNHPYPILDAIEVLQRAGR